MVHPWPVVPRDRPVYSGLPTDFWPWPEALHDLTRRPGLSAILEISPDPGATPTARAIWADGHALGVHTDLTTPEGQAPGAPTDLTALAVTYPRATLSLYIVDPAVARLAWQCLLADTQSPPAPWSTLRTQLAFRAYTGMVRAPSGDSYWQAGVRIAGREPRSEELVALLSPSLRHVTSAAVLEFFNAALLIARREVPVDDVWHATVMELADMHACLDPFAREVLLEGGQLSLGADVPADELLPALRDGFQLAVNRAGRRLAQLPLESLRANPLWSHAGFGES